MLRILHDTNYDFIKHWKTAVIGTAAFMMLGLAFLGYHAARTGHALNYSVEFTGGAEIQIQLAQPPSADAVRAAVDQAGFSGAEVTTFGDASNYLVKVQQVAGEAAATNAEVVGAKIVAALSQGLPNNPSKVVRATSVGSRVGDELQT